MLGVETDGWCGRFTLAWTKPTPGPEPRRNVRAWWSLSQSGLEGSQPLVTIVEGSLPKGVTERSLYKYTYSSLLNNCKHFTVKIRKTL